MTFKDFAHLRWLRRNNSIFDRTSYKMNTLFTAAYNNITSENKLSKTFLINISRSVYQQENFHSNSSTPSIQTENNIISNGMFSLFSDLKGIPNHTHIFAPF